MHPDIHLDGGIYIRKEEFTAASDHTIIRRPASVVGDGVDYINGATVWAWAVLAGILFREHLFHNSRGRSPCRHRRQWG